MRPSAVPPAPQEWRVGDRVAELYEIRDVVRSGGMGLVYRARHLTWEMDLAVKVPRPELVATADGVERFAAEAETWVDLGVHPQPCLWELDWDHEFPPVADAAPEVRPYLAALRACRGDRPGPDELRAAAARAGFGWLSERGLAHEWAAVTGDGRDAVPGHGQQDDGTGGHEAWRSSAARDAHG